MESNLHVLNNGELCVRIFLFSEFLRNQREELKGPKGWRMDGREREFICYAFAECNGTLIILLYIYALNS